MNIHIRIMKGSGFIKNIRIRIFKDGTITSETVGYKGDACLKCVEIIQDIVEGRIVDSSFTEEYYEPVIINLESEEHIKCRI